MSKEQCKAVLHTAAEYLEEMSGSDGHWLAMSSNGRHFG